MGLFDIFKGKNDHEDLESLVIGFFRIETGKLLGLEVHTNEFNDACKSAGEALQVLLVPLLDRKIQQDVATTLSSVCTNRLDEAFSQYLILLYVRFGAIQRAISEGSVQAEEATADILANVLHDQIKSLVS